MSAISVRAHAKINLDLRVLGRRPDGYHELCTIFQTLSLHDGLVFRATRRAFTLECGAPGVPRDRTNLVWRAAQALWSATGRRGDVRGVSVTLQKRIPAQAGLGGGSSDAAVTLLALDELWRLRLERSDLARLAGALGSDVPFFLAGGTALGLGRGERLYPLPDLPSMGVLLVQPAYGVATSDAYRWFSSAKRPERQHVQALQVPWFLGPLELGNDLEGPVAQRHPEILEIRRALLRHGAEVALMSGSGSAVFGLFRTVEHARRASARLARSGWTATVTRTLGRAACRRRSRPMRATGL